MPALGASVAVHSKRSRAAPLDSPHYLMLGPGDARAAALDKAGAIDTEDIGHLEGGPVHGFPGSPDDFGGTTGEGRVSRRWR